MAFSISQTIDWAFDHWYFFVIFIGAILLIGYIDKYNKLKRKVQYHDEIEQIKKIKFKELEFNPTPIKKLLYYNKKWRVYGEIIQAFFKGTEAQIKQPIGKELTAEEIKNKQLEHLKDEILKRPKADFYTHEFLIRRKNFLGVFFGEREVVKVFDTDFKQIKADTIRFNEKSFSLHYRDGRLERLDYEMISVTRDDTERLMSDNKVNAMGYQQKDFSRIRTDYSHDELMKDKEKEIEESKKKGRGSFGG